MEVQNLQVMDCRRPRRRWLRFSLRAAMIALTLICVWLGLTANRANRQKRSVEALRKAGAEVSYDYEVNEYGSRDPRKPTPPAPGPDWLRNIIGVDYFATAATVNFHPQDDILEETFDSLADLPHLRSLAFANIQVTDARIARLANLTELQVLTLRNSSIADGGWEFLEHFSRLKRLQLDGRNVNDFTLSHIKGLAELRHLILFDNQVSDAGLKDLAGLSNLETLWLRGHRARSTVNFRLANSATKSSSGISNAGLQCLKHLSHLKVLEIDLSVTSVTAADLADLKQSLPNLKVPGH